MGDINPAGDALAVIDQVFEASWRAAQPNLRRRARRLARGNPDRAEEWLASTALKALLFMRRSPERIRDPQGFLFLVLEHVYLDSVRRRQREERLFDFSIDLQDDSQERFPAPHSVLESLERQEQLSLIERALTRLPAAQRQLFELRFIEERPYADIAVELGVTPILARKRVQLLRHSLHAATGR
ncbi:RNA polymerase sigma factor [Pseudomonas mangiferae]|uniref:Sigma-70 family RNA polymerase sigma factor n=1 Tax=Pseudomonas mangiferae TaxID=2593654 RepID=A0A553GZR0_9PSED|nr:sigma-70 family RNA polymerase sigma factor [Pseudomonas mangiferae]TRX74977.1 sigma-70 family RNA polymerase sigma factor [Pseudomonas mangiferae]